MNILKSICYCCILLIAFLSSGALPAAPPSLQLSNVYHEQIDLSDYWVSEKLDGIRAYWDGKNLISRQGHLINAPPWFIENFPAEPLDGELWIGRNLFEEVSSIVRKKQPDPDQWKKIKFMVFDMPKNPDIFSNRIIAARKLIATSRSPYLQWVMQFKVSDHENLMIQLNHVVQNSGEGLMLHRGDSRYQAIRNDDLLKVKTFEDAEAIVIAYVEGQGKYTGMMGALIVENAEKIKFKIGTGFTDQQRKNPPEIGSTITYKYLGKTKNNLPRFASFIRVREDNIPK